jgi:transcriptional regulator with XRE-family HTH domain
MRDGLDLLDMPSTLAANLQRLIGSSTQQEIADKARMSRTALNKILQGDVDPRLSTVQALADALGQPIGALTGEVETSELSPDALQIGLLYEGLDLDDQAFVRRLLRKLAGDEQSTR